MEGKKPGDGERAIVRDAVTGFVIARERWNRLEKGRIYEETRAAFVAAFGWVAWRKVFDDVVEESQLGDFISDVAELRGSERT